MQTRRQFVAAAGTAAAAAILAPGGARAGAAPRRSPAAGASRRASCRASRRRAAITLWSRLHESAGASAPSSRSPATASSAASSPASRSRRPGAKGHALKARVTGPKPARAVLLPLLHAHDGRPGRALPDGAPAPTRGSRCTSRSGPARTSPTASTTRTTCSPREDLDFVVCLGDYIYAETEETRRDRGARPTASAAPGPTARARRSRSTTTARSTACTAPTRPSAACTPASRP